MYKNILYQLQSRFISLCNFLDILYKVLTEQVLYMALAGQGLFVYII